MPTLILGIITLGLSPLPILNQGGILVGFVGAGLGIAALIVGLRRHVRVVIAAIGLGLSILGLIASFAFTQSFVNRLNSLGSNTSAGPSTPAQPRCAVDHELLIVS
jgi:cytochrome c biogenesis protein CcdA